MSVFDYIQNDSFSLNREQIWNRNKVVAIVQARMGSTRFPGKVLFPMTGKPALQWCVERIRKARTIDEIVVATTANPRDLPIVAFCWDVLNCSSFCGSEDDVLDRVFKAAQHTQAGYIVDITADCPFVDPEQIDMIVKNVKKYGYIYGSNIDPRSWPDGFDIQVYPRKTLNVINRIERDEIKRCHVGWNILNRWAEVASYFYEKVKRFQLISSIDYTNLECTLDTLEDLRLMNKMLEEFYRKNTQDIFTVNDVIQYLQRIRYISPVKRKIPGEG